MFGADAVREGLDKAQDGVPGLLGTVSSLDECVGERPGEIFSCCGDEAVSVDET